MKSCKFLSPGAREVHSICASDDYADDGKDSSRLCPFLLIREGQEDDARCELSDAHERDVRQRQAAL